jgi:two-component system response regulator PilR (NtrC family)
VTHFLKKYCAQTGRNLGINDKSLQLLEEYSWPGNVRELEHTIERAVALEPSGEIQPERLPVAVTNYRPTAVRTMSGDSRALPEDGLNLVAHLDHLEKAFVLEALERTEYSQSRAAELLYLSVRSLRHLLDKHGIRHLTAQMREDRRQSDSTPRRRATDPEPRRRAYDVSPDELSKAHPKQ